MITKSILLHFVVIHGSEVLHAIGTTRALVVELLLETKEIHGDWAMGGGDCPWRS